MKLQQNQSQWDLHHHRQLPAFTWGYQLSHLQAHGQSHIRRRAIVKNQTPRVFHKLFKSRLHELLSIPSKTAT